MTLDQAASWFLFLFWNSTFALIAILFFVLLACVVIGPSNRGPE